MANQLIRHFNGGFVRFHLLHHAEEEPICGVDMMEELARHGYRLGPGTLYPILHNLRTSGYLTCREEVVAGKRRKNYRITKKGTRLLKEARRKLHELVVEVLPIASILQKSTRRT